MQHTFLTAGMLVDAEVAYRHERLATDLATAHGVLAWWRGRRRTRTARRDADLALAA